MRKGQMNDFIIVMMIMMMMMMTASIDAIFSLMMSQHMYSLMR